MPNLYQDFFFDKGPINYKNHDHSGTDFFFL